MRTDVVVLGAGIVGASVAVHLQKRGRAVLLVDRQAPGEGTSFGNTGLIQREAVYPYGFPRRWSEILRHGLEPLDRFALSLGLAAPASAVPGALLVAFGHRAPRRDRAEIRAADRALRARASRARRRGGRDRAPAARRLDQALPHACRDGRARPRRREMGARVRHRIRGARSARACREGAASRPDADRRAALPGARRGQGPACPDDRLCRPAGEARRQPRRRRCREPGAGGDGWRVATETGRGRGAARSWSRSAPGPTWSPSGSAIACRSAVKRGYHMHYRPAGNAVLNHTDPRRRARLLPGADGDAASASPPARSSPTATRRRRRSSSGAPSRSRATFFPLGERLDPRARGWGCAPARPT